MRNNFSPSLGDREDVLNVCILLTDGKSADRQLTWDEALAAKKEGIHIVAIGVGPSVGITELEGIASDPDEANVFVVSDFNSLSNVIVPILEGTCNSKSSLPIYVGPASFIPSACITVDIQLS